jgi:2-keto-3-deoxy-galactonokinase
MVGSSIGWVEAPYLACPARPKDIAAACARVREGRIRIVPGLSCRNRFDAPDVMRGEETQILGALDLQPDLRQGRRLLCLPGTHTKWVLLEEGVHCDPQLQSRSHSRAAYLKLFPAATYGPRHLQALRAVLPAAVSVWPVGGVVTDMNRGDTALAPLAILAAVNPFS